MSRNHNCSQIYLCLFQTKFLNAMPIANMNTIPGRIFFQGKYKHFYLNKMVTREMVNYKLKSAIYLK